MDNEGWIWLLSLLLTIVVVLIFSLLVSVLFPKKKKEEEEEKKISTSALPDTSTAASAEASLVSGGYDYEVFLSFRGSDTRIGFTDFLYTDLIGAGIRTFRDDEELRVGEEIGPELLNAINNSKIYIPIFSQNYASSKWCLLELSHMLHCHKTTGQLIWPIFYETQPYDVRHQTGSYEKPFREHQSRFGRETVQKWREVLSEVGALKGWESLKFSGG